MVCVCVCVFSVLIPVVSDSLLAGQSSARNWRGFYKVIISPVCELEKGAKLYSNLLL